MNQDDHFITLLPEAPALKGLVAYYYLHHSHAPSGKCSYQYYPHYRNGLTAYLDAEVEFSDAHSEVRPAQSSCFTALYSRVYQQRIRVNIEGPFRKLGIAFEPLGFNHFLPAPLSEVAPDTVNTFQLWPDFEQVLRQAYGMPYAQVASLLDTYLMGKLQPFRQNELKTALHQLISEDGCTEVQAMAEHMAMSRKTLLRLYQRHLCCSVEAYKNLIKFRNALNDYRESAERYTFTELAHKHRYYDQPAFIKHFKAVTGLSPRAFFAGLKQYGERDTFWRPE